MIYALVSSVNFTLSRFILSLSRKVLVMSLITIPWGMLISLCVFVSLDVLQM